MNWFRNLKVAYKILISCSLFIVMLVLAVTFSITSMKSTQASVKDYRENSVLPVIKMDAITKNLLQARINMFAAYVALGENKNEELKQRLKDTEKIREENLKILQVIKNRSMSDEEKKLTEEYVALYMDLGTIMNTYNAAINSGNRESIQQAMDKWLEQFQKVKGSLDSLHAKSIEVGAGKINAEFWSMNMIMIYLLVILLISAITGTIITIILSRAISRPVKKGLDFAQKIADGDFTERIDLSQKDELGMLAEALNKSADNLEQTVANILDSSNNLAQAVEQIASGNQNLSQRTSEQASALEEVAATIEEANSSINQNYQNSTEAKKMSEISSDVANQGGLLVEEAVQSINEVNSSAKKIGEITNVINEIAFQTNLLALNAAVEAARAGDQGRGFAVVAGEVRNLAQRAGNAAKEIAHLISDTVAKVEDGTEKTYKSGTSLKEIIESVANVASFVGDIAASSNEQKQGMDQIATAISDLDSMTQHNAALVEETASASEEMANQAQELMSLMSLFKIRVEKSSSNDNLRVSGINHAALHASAAPVKAKEQSGGNGKNGNGKNGNGKNMPHPAVIAAEKNNIGTVLDTDGYEQF